MERSTNPYIRAIKRLLIRKFVPSLKKPGAFLIACASTAPLTHVSRQSTTGIGSEKQIHAYYIIGEDPAQSDPDLPEIRETLSKIDFVVIQDIFFNKTSEYADVIFPATAWGRHEAVYSACDRRFSAFINSSDPDRTSRRTGKFSAL